jgi:hypothetical protein
MPQHWKFTNSQIYYGVLRQVTCYCIIISINTTMLEYHRQTEQTIPGGGVPAQPIAGQRQAGRLISISPRKVANHGAALPETPHLGCP